MVNLSVHYIEHKVDSLIESSIFFGKIFGWLRLGGARTFGQSTPTKDAARPFPGAAELTRQAQVIAYLPQGLRRVARQA
jgi:hypothetical protein